MISSLNPAADQLHSSIESQQIIQHPQIQVDADHYTIDNRWFTFNELCFYIQLLKLKQQEIVCYVLTDILYFWYWELKFAMLFFHEIILCDLYPAVLKDAWLKKWNENIQTISHYWRNDIITVQIIFSIWIHFFVMCWYKTEFLKVINYLCLLALCTQGN